MGGQVDGQILHLGSALNVGIPGPQGRVSDLGVTYGSRQELVSVQLKGARRPGRQGEEGLTAPWLGARWRHPQTSMTHLRSWEVWR